MAKTNNLNVGNDSVVIGDVGGNVGDGSVVIGATDQNGNTILNKTMAIGRGASAGKDSIAIGAGASAGSNSVILLSKLKDILDANEDKESSKKVDDLILEVSKKEPDVSKIKQTWDLVKNAVTLSNAVDLITKISSLIDKF